MARPLTTARKASSGPKFSIPGGPAIRATGSRGGDKLALQGFKAADIIGAGRAVRLAKRSLKARAKND